MSDMDISPVWPSAQTANLGRTDLTVRRLLKAYTWQVGAAFMHDLPNGDLDGAEIYTGMDHEYTEDGVSVPFADTTPLANYLVDWLFSMPSQIETEGDLRRFLAKLVVCDGVAPLIAKDNTASPYISLMPIFGQTSLPWNNEELEQMKTALRVACRQFGGSVVLEHAVTLIELLSTPM